MTERPLIKEIDGDDVSMVLYAVVAPLTVPVANGCPVQVVVAAVKLRSASCEGIILHLRSAGICDRRVKLDDRNTTEEKRKKQN